jgi:hypothetical protein
MQALSPSPILLKNAGMLPGCRLSKKSFRQPGMKCAILFEAALPRA